MDIDRAGIAMSLQTAGASAADLLHYKEGSRHQHGPGTPQNLLRLVKHLTPELKPALP